MTKVDHIRLIYKRPFHSIGDDVVFDDGGPPPTDQELADTYDDALSAHNKEIAARQQIQSITARQLRLWLFSNKLLGAVEEMVDNIGGEVKIEWEYATEYQRNHPTVVQLGLALGMTSEQLDNVFISASML